MTWPREGSRDVHDGIIVSQVPDICLTQQGGTMVPVPYTIWCRQADAANLANSIHQTDDRTHAKESLVLKCYGDEPGTGGGIRSGTTGAECTPKTWSASVFVEGRNMVRHDDEWWMNHRNTYGKLIYTKDMDHAEISDPRAIPPTMAPEHGVGSLSNGPRPASSFSAQTTPLGAGSPAIGAGIGGAVAGPPGAVVGLAAGTAVLIAGVVVYIFTGSRTSRKPDKCPCVVAPYRQLRYVCGKACVNGQAHHIIPDYTKRYGSRIEGEIGFKRIKGLANFQQGMSICLQGNAKDDFTAHWEAHGADKQIADLGNHPDAPLSPTGTAPILDIAEISRDQTISARKDCEAQIRAGVAQEMGNVNPNLLGRTYPDARYPPSVNTVPFLSGQSPTVH
ncbi:hypothetical protein ASF27_21205 [Methylobacterium sp. Leaf102]|uniref:DUF4150 domain-containing protein n=1 Tax=Methylobacterium sp. Leaf102 TaxID=1736253 RepID=UPI0006FCAAEA|nr:DUF4150 domain-containing protein [Methylobacterium sp. Leaf102]KQP25801.1 hypothetical protein ASF27_21205 [Methylobacterium sp. Leaf102]